MHNALICARRRPDLPRPGAGFGYPPGRTRSAMLVAAAVGPGHHHHLAAASAVPGQLREQYPQGNISERWLSAPGARAQGCSTHSAATV